MKKRIKLAVIHSRRPEVPVEAHPLKKEFTIPGLQSYLERNLEKYIRYLHEAGRNKADLACTQEDFLGAGIYMMHIDRPHLFASCAEEIPGPVFFRLSEIAKLYSMYIAANFYEKDKDGIYNTSVLVGRDSRLIGKYRKVHMPPYENGA